MAAPSETDLLVIGGGPAGLACAVQAARDGLEVVLCSDEPLGGLLFAARRIENLPGFPAGISGERLARLMAEQVAIPSIQVRAQRVLGLTRQEEIFVAELDQGDPPRARAAVLATGTSPASVDLPGIGQLTPGQRLHRDLRSLPRVLDDKRVLVLGGGDAAFDTALSLHDRGARVILALRGARPRANTHLVQAAETAGVEVSLRERLVGVETAGEALSVELRGEGRALGSSLVDHLVLCVGRRPRGDLLEALDPAAIERGQVQGSVPGLFLAGDLIRGRDRYVATAMGDGQRAARLAEAYLARSTEARQRDAGESEGRA